MLPLLRFIPLYEKGKERIIMNNELVSIIVPVYGVENYIELSVESICKQTYKNIEVILVDDETKDNSISVAENVLKKYPYIKYKIVKEKNKGLPGARNEGAKYAKGTFLCFVDSDDCIANTHVERMLALINTNKLMICYSEFEATSEEKRFGVSEDCIETEVIEQEELMNDFSLRKRKIHCCSLMISKQLFEKYRFNERLRFGEDVEFMWRVFSNIERIGHCNQKSYKYLIRPNSLMTSYSSEKDKVFVNEFKTTIDRLIKEFPNREKMYKNVYYRNILGWMHQLARKTTYKQFLDGISLIELNEMKRVLNEVDDKKVRILNDLLKINIRAFYFCLSKV